MWRLVLLWVAFVCFTISALVWGLSLPAGPAWGWFAGGFAAWAGSKVPT